MRSKYIFLITTKQNIFCKIKIIEMEYFDKTPQNI